MRWVACRRRACLLALSTFLPSSPAPLNSVLSVCLSVHLSVSLPISVDEYIHVYPSLPLYPKLCTTTMRNPHHPLRAPPRGRLTISKRDIVRAYLKRRGAAQARRLLEAWGVRLTLRVRKSPISKPRLSINQCTVSTECEILMCTVPNHRNPLRVAEDGLYLILKGFCDRLTLAIIS